jgi:preprotein translocase subunit SecA
VIDYLWTRHLTTMEQLRHSIGLQAYGQKDPLVQYKVKAYELFEDLKGEIRQLVVLNVLMMGGRAEEARAQIRRSQQTAQMEQKQAAQASAAQGTNGKIKPGVSGQRPAQSTQANGQNRGTAPKPGGNGGRPASTATATVAAGAQRKIGRNDPCYCGSGKKFKHCHGR